jgi:hypothetical protein
MLLELNQLINISRKDLDTNGTKKSLKACVA